MMEQDNICSSIYLFFDSQLILNVKCLFRILLTTDLDNINWNIDTNKVFQKKR